MKIDQLHTLEWVLHTLRMVEDIEDRDIGYYADSYNFTFYYKNRSLAVEMFGQLNFIGEEDEKINGLREIKLRIVMS